MPQWDDVTEMVAMAVEELSRLTREAPIHIVRPGEDPTEHPAPAPAPSTPTPTRSPATPAVQSTPTGGTVVNGMAAMIQFAADSGRSNRSTQGE